MISYVSVLWVTPELSVRYQRLAVMRILVLMGEAVSLSDHHTAATVLLGGLVLTVSRRGTNV